MTVQERPLDCIIDCDPGIDDAMSIFFALGTQKLNILGLTIVHGNLCEGSGVLKLYHNARKVC